MPGVLLEDLLRPRSGPWVIAHRGASRHAPENTMPAFEAAWASGCGWIEADVQPTRDNVPVVLHDEELSRTTNGSGPIRHLSSLDVLALDAGSWFTTGSTRAYSRTPVPLLADVVQTLGPGRALLLEIKNDHTRDQVLAEMAVVKASGWDDRVFYESFHTESLRHVQAIEPGRPVGLLVEELHDDPIAACAELGAIAYNPRHTLLRDRPELVGQLHDAGIAVMAWTADEPDDWTFLTELGVDGIITNTPGDLISFQRTAHGRLSARSG
ncbi:glycerophosphoryl diester phosphodiesterase [Nakamurella sp. UYEF19]|uniref:glycerophosphodiester phosphodiesterase n=1 Tax=Nakamurella sp. UYEF19 TaxID=1756392 RepID=UPI003394FAAE